MANSKFSKKRASNKHRQRKNSRKNMRGGSSLGASPEVVTHETSTGVTTYMRPPPQKPRLIAERAKSRHRDRYYYDTYLSIIL